MEAKKLIILEGEDGTGKSTLAQQLKTALPDGAEIFHLGPFKGVTRPASLCRLYIDAMMPALLGHSNVIMDRCWLSEPIYGEIYRGGKSRLDPVDQRMLERIALTANTLVVQCRAPWRHIEKTFQARRGQEYLANTTQLFEVAKLYDGLPANTMLPLVRFDFSYSSALDVLSSMSSMASRPHSTNINTAGNIDAPVLIVGEEFADHDNDSPLRQWPFVSFQGRGCSRWLTLQLHHAGIRENDLLWINSDQLPLIVGALFDVSDEDRGDKRLKVVALGEEARRACGEARLDSIAFAHPQYWKRFNNGAVYALTEYLRSTLHVKEIAS